MTSFIYWHRTIHTNYNDANQRKTPSYPLYLKTFKDSFLEPQLQMDLGKIKYVMYSKNCFFGSP